MNTAEITRYDYPILYILYEKCRYLCYFEANLQLSFLHVECRQQAGQCAAVFSFSFLCSVQIQVKSYLLRNEIGIGNQDYRDSSTGTVE